MHRKNAMLGLLAGGLAVALAIDNGKARTPPMGWRSWNLYGGKINQDLMEKIMDGIAARRRTVDGVPTSLCDLGYCDVGLDDVWQKCGSYGKNKYSYHSDAGFPMVDATRFPDMLAMTNHAHKLGLTAGWYLNNCVCNDHCGSQDWHRPENDTKCYVGDTAALIEFGFDSVKLDGCGAQLDLNLWARLFNESGKPILVENCHWGKTLPNATWCPWHLYRSCGDVRASYGSVINNLQSVAPLAKQGLSRPGCWAYPDMLEVGCQHGPGGQSDPGLSFFETRSHFGAWAIVSSPLVLSHDVNNETVMDFVWDIIANKEVIAINQAWAGHSGSPFKESNERVMHEWLDLPPTHSRQHGQNGRELEFFEKNTHSSKWQYLYKPLTEGGTKMAVLLMNHDVLAANLFLKFKDVPGLNCSKCSVRDVWSHQDLGLFQDNFTAVGVPSHDSFFLVVMTASSEPSEVWI